MNDIMNAENIVNKILEDTYKKGLRLSQETHLAITYVLYGYHKHYDVEEVTSDSFKFSNDDDELLHDLYNQIERMDVRMNPAILSSFYDEIKTIPHDRFEFIYPEILANLNEQTSIRGGLRYGDFYTPDEILSLIAYFVNKERCYKVFDPFCGTASIVNHLEHVILFFGQDINPFSTLLARVVLEASHISYSEIRCTDSLVHWRCHHAEAVIACPPFGIRLTEEQKRYGSRHGVDCKTLEDVVFTNSFKYNHADLLITLVSPSVTFKRGNDKEIRKFLIEHNYLDTVISLPSNLLYSTSLPAILMICKRHRDFEEPVTFIHAENYFIGENKFNRKFDIKRFLSLFESEDSVDMVKVDNESIRNNDYNLYPDLYANTQIELKGDQQFVPLHELITPFQASHGMDNPNTITDIVTRKLLSDDFNDVILNKNKSEDKKDDKQNFPYRYYHSTNNDDLLIVSDFPSIRYGLRTNTESFFACKSPIRVYRINSELVDPEYLVHVLLGNPALQKGGMPLSGYGNLQLIVDSDKRKQRDIVDGLKFENASYVQSEKNADKMRFNVQQNISDLEHIIAPTLFEINQIVSTLGRITPDSGIYPQMIKSLKDNFDYMARIIHYTNANFTNDSFRKKEGDLSEFMHSYIEGWENYKGGYFQLNLIDDEHPISSCFDKTLLTVMLDAILTNAIYHGFHKQKDYAKQKNYAESNKVEITITKVEYEERAYACLSIANNGDPISDGFTIQDYISRGRFSLGTGRSGLGGNHVYQIVKGHDGFLCLDSNKQWNTIVEILLPINNSVENLKQYEHECI